MKTAWLYAGQGSQKKGMGADLYEKYPSFRAAFDSAELSFDLKKVCFEDPDEVLNQTEYTQPCMEAFACGVTAVLKEKGLKPDYVAGLSLGEYSALEAAGVFDAKTAIETVAYRGKVMSEASKGMDVAMYAVMGLSEEDLKACCEKASAKGVVSICNYNCPGQLVIGGEKAAVEECVRLAGEAGARRSVALAVSGPFHTSLMKPAGDALAEYFKKMDLGAPIVTVLYNYLGKENTENMPIADILVMQVQRSVRMDMILMNLFNKGVRRFIEIGPGKAITGFVKKTAKQLMVDDFECYTIDGAEDLEKVLEL